MRKGTKLADEVEAKTKENNQLQVRVDTNGLRAVYGDRSQMHPISHDISRSLCV